LKHKAVRTVFERAGGDPKNLVESEDARKNFIYESYDKKEAAGLVRPPARMWWRDDWACTEKDIVGARVERHENYERNLRLWNWRPGTPPAG
jgi:hypothetical protein